MLIHPGPSPPASQQSNEVHLFCFETSLFIGQLAVCACLRAIHNNEQYAREVESPLFVYLNQKKKNKVRQFLKYKVSKMTAKSTEQR